MALREGQSLAVVEAKALVDGTSNEMSTEQQKIKRNRPRLPRQPRNHFLPPRTMLMMAKYALFAHRQLSTPRFHLATTELATFVRSGFAPCIRTKAVPIVG